MMRRRYHHKPHAEPQRSRVSMFSGTSFGGEGRTVLGGREASVPEATQHIHG
ncbi:MAG: hypothetical protein K2N48_12140 [Muribaculaceae bacterium]|nr:hypothetical protein [Muribaculaceae bacterium]